MDEDELRRDLANLYRLNPKSNILVRADGSRPYKEVMKLLKAVKESGFSNVSLITQAEGK